MPLDIRGLVPLIMVFDMPTSLGFYRDVLGFDVVQDSGQRDESVWVMLEQGGARLMLNTAYEAAERPVVPDATRCRSHSDTCLYFGCPDPAAAYRFLTSKGLRLDPPGITAYGMNQLYVRDPDGYDLCFQWPAQP
jgi:catechol 2,3-dioxygenase-like lactoylglutathione lyase family enzyme